MATIAVGDTPIGLALDSAGTRLYVTNCRSNTEWVIDSAVNAVIATIAVGVGPRDVALAAVPPTSVVACGISGAGHISGTEGDDVVCGSAGPDRIAGLGGNDVIFGLGGDDQILGGDGNDVMLGGEGDDRLAGGNGDDHLFGGGGSTAPGTTPARRPRRLHCVVRGMTTPSTSN